MNEQEPVDIFALAARPIGSRALEQEAKDAFYHEQHGGRASLSPELRETVKRTSQRWLPAGKKSAADANRRAHDDAMARQTDLEDAVEQAGGTRGGPRQSSALQSTCAGRG